MFFWSFGTVTTSQRCCVRAKLKYWLPLATRWSAQPHSVRSL